MKTIIAGSRTATERHTFMALMSCEWRESITIVLCGMAESGADLHGKAWAIANKIPVEDYPANWAVNGRAAGPIRNQQMVDHADALIAVWDGKSSGTADVIRRARREGITVHVLNYITGEVY